MTADRDTLAATIREFLRAAEYFDDEDGADDFAKAMTALDALLASVAAAERAKAIAEAGLKIGGDVIYERWQTAEARVAALEADLETEREAHAAEVGWDGATTAMERAEARVVALEAKRDAQENLWAQRHLEEQRAAMRMVERAEADLQKLRDYIRGLGIELPIDLAAGSAAAEETQP